MEGYNTQQHGRCHTPDALRQGGLHAGVPERIALPLPPAMGEETRVEMEVYARFMRHLRQVPNSRMEIKILSSLQFTADMLDMSDALVAKIMVDLGLRAPRKAFPMAFLDFADRAMQRRAWDRTAVPPAVLALKEHWDRIGEDRFASASRAFGVSALIDA